MYYSASSLPGEAPLPHFIKFVTWCGGLERVKFLINFNLGLRINHFALKHAVVDKVSETIQKFVEKKII